MEDSIEKVNSSNKKQQITWARAIWVIVYTLSMVLWICLVFIGGFFTLLVFWLHAEWKLWEKEIFYLYLSISIIIFFVWITLMRVSIRWFKWKIKEWNFFSNTKEKSNWDDFFYSIIAILWIGLVLFGLFNLLLSPESIDKKKFTTSILSILSGIIIIIISLIWFNWKKINNHDRKHINPLEKTIQKR